VAVKRRRTRAPAHQRCKHEDADQMADVLLQCEFDVHR